MRAPYRNRFDPEQTFLVRKPTTVGGRRFEYMERFDKLLVSERRLRQLFTARVLIYAGQTEPGGKLSPSETAATFRGQHASRAHAAQAQRAKLAAEKAEREAAAKLAKTSKIDAEKAAKAAKAEADRAAKEAARAERQATEDAAKAEADAAAESAKAEAAAAASGSADEPPAEPPVTPPTETVTGDAAVRAARAAVEIPADWATLPWPKRLQLAAQLTEEKVKNGEDAAKAITEELKARGTS